MSRFIVKLVIFSVFPILSLLGVFLLENGTADPFYQRFTSSKQKSLIIGNSKAAQGILPSILNDKIDGAYLYNYSFSINTSPYGAAYLRSIKMKLKEETRDGVFIIAVDPWAFQEFRVNEKNNSPFEESSGFLERLVSVNCPFNLQYMLLWFENSYYEIVLRRWFTNHSILHSDGWFQTGQSNNVSERRRILLEYYKKRKSEHKYSKYRFEAFKEIIDFLSLHGKVFLVRLPIHKDLLKLEEQVDPCFNYELRKIEYLKKIEYFDYSTLNGIYFKDGIHMTVESARDFSNILSNKIILSNN